MPAIPLVLPPDREILTLFRPLAAPIQWEIGGSKYSEYVWTAAEWASLGANDRETVGRRSQTHPNGCVSLLCLEG